MATLEDIMLSIQAKDDASNVFKTVGSNAQSMASTITNAINSANTGFQNLSNVSNNLVTSLSNGKTAAQLLFDTTSKAETNSVLVNMMSDTADSAARLNEHIDNVTNTSLVSMQNLIPAMNAFKTATGATDDQIYDATEGIAAFGAKVLAQTGSVELSEQAMMDLSKGIKGACASLDQYGITEDALKRTGLWNGEEDDIKGYIAAVQQLTGDTSALMETNEGLDARLGKAFSSAGKKIGNEFLPQLKDLKKGFLELNSATGGDLAAGIIVAAEAVDMFSQGMGMVAQTTQGIRGIADAFSATKDAIGIATDYLKRFREAEEVASGAKIVGETTDISGLIGGIEGAKDIGKVADEAEDVVEDAAKIGALGPEAAAAGAEIEATSGGLSAITAGASSMLVPLLSLAIVIAVMIPVVTALAAEALLCMKGIQMLVDALDFGGIDINDDLEGIKKIGELLLNIGIVMAEMTFAATMTAIYNFVSGLFLIVNPIQLAVDQIKEVVPVINQLANVEDINESIPGKLEKLGKSLQSIATATSAMTSTTVTVGWGNFVAWIFDFSSSADAMSQAKDDLLKAAEEVNKLKDLPEIDSSVASKLESVGKSLSSVSESFNALRSIRDNFNWDSTMGQIFKGVDIQTAITNIKQDIVNAANALKNFDNLPEIPQGIGDKLKKISDSLKSVSDAIGTLRSFRDDQNWDAAMSQIFNGADIATTLSNVKTTIEKSATTLNTFNSIPEVQPGIATKVTKVADATKVVANAINIMVGSNIPDVTVLTAMPEKITAAKNLVQKTATALNGLTGIAEIPEGLYTKVSRVGTSAKNVGTAVSAIKTIPQVDPGISNKIKLAVTSVKKTATELNKLSGTNVNDVGGILSSVRNALNQLRSTLQSMGGSFQASAQGIGAGIKAGVVSGMSGLDGEVNAQAVSAMAVFNATMITGATTAGTGARTAFQASFKLADIAAAEMNYAVQAVNNGAGALADACRRAAEQAVAAAQEGAQSHSPGAIARMWGKEIGEYSVQKVLEGASLLVNTVRNTSRRVVNAWGTPTLGVNTNIGMLNNIPTIGEMRNLAGLGRIMPQMQSSNKTIIFDIKPGAFKLDARNMTQTECAKIVTLGLENINQVQDVNLKGA
ncbi:MAG: hypothetical protein IJF83_05915 [Methanobrevibacter sp.]|nr:hypothetical protein [Methanobrevibacter sp.]MBQ2653073.1 hypothetical protein [Methanobrevibacter sp.]